MIRKIFVPIRGDGEGENVLRHALALAKRFNAHIEATHCRPRPQDLMPFGVPMPGFLKEQIAKQADEVADAEEQALRAEFDSLVDQFGIPMTDTPRGDVASIGWIEEVGKQVDVIRNRARMCDLIVVPKPNRDRNLGSNTLKSALFASGRPVMMCPRIETSPQVLGDHVAFAWNGSLEATRAVAMTATVVAAASEVTILAIDEKPGHPADATAFATYLAAHGVAAKIHRADSGGDVGGALLNEADAVGADLLIMGAYGDSHEKETIFGGNTQTIVDTAIRPVLMVH
ncbi:MAG: universal stress protein [Rhodobacteraceae bacterium]|nr:universal stress protein [Paracoccaceae bacterium]